MVLGFAYIVTRTTTFECIDSMKIHILINTLRDKYSSVRE